MHEFQVSKETFCAGTLNWVKSNIGEFDPTAHKGNGNLRLKALSELLFLCSLYKRKFKVLRPPFDEFVTYGVEVVRRVNYADGMHRNPELILPYSIIYKSLRECGVTLEGQKGVIQSMLGIGLPMATEDNPYRKMELRYALEDGGFRGLPPSIRTLFRGTSLCTTLRDTPPVLSFRLEQIYGLTHVVFYLTDFGLSTKTWVPKVESLRWLVSAMLGIQTLERNWDAVAELLMCCNFLDYFPSPLYRHAWTGLFKAQKSNGSLTDNFFDEKKFESMGAPERDRYYFDQHYHTTIVSAAAAFLTDDRNVNRKEDQFYAMHGYTLPDCATAVARARDWVFRTYADRSGRLSLPSLLHVLMGEWVAALRVGDRRRERRPAFYARIHDEIEGLIRISPNAVDDCDPALVLLGEGILRMSGLGIPEFELLASSSSEALRSNRSSVGLGVSLFPVTHLLESLGFEPNPRPARDREWEVAVDYESEASEALVRTLANYVSRKTSFGSRELQTRDPRLMNRIRGDLAMLTFYHLHHYKLEEGLVLVRAMNHAGMDASKSLKESIDFVLAQQKDDGSFGFYADEIALIRRSDPEFDDLERITLPTTVSAMWTISEAARGGLSLFNSIRTK
jgi:hypothetical protein